MNGDFFQLISYSLFGYSFTVLGIILGTFVVTKAIRKNSAKKKKTYQFENVILDTYKERSQKIEDDSSEDQDDVIYQDDIVSDEADLKSQIKDDIENIFSEQEAVNNEPITYSDIASCFDDNNISNFVENNRKKEDHSYGVIQREIEEKNNHSN